MVPYGCQHNCHYNLLPDGDARISDLGNIRRGDLHIGPFLVDPILNTNQGLPGNGFVRADCHETQYGHGRIVLAVHLGAGHIEPVARTAQDALDDAALFLEGAGREGKMQFQAMDEHGLWTGFPAVGDKNIY